MAVKRGSTLVQNDRFKITRSGDERCWIYEEWLAGGISRKTGQPSPGYWHTVGYYGSPEDLAKYLLRRQIEVPEGTLQTQLKDLLAEIKAAEARIVEGLRQAA